MPSLRVPRPLLLTLTVLLSGGAFLQAAERDVAADQSFPAATAKRMVIDAAAVDVHLRAADVPAIVVETRLHIAGLGEHKADAWIEAHTPAAVDTDDLLRVTVPAQGAGFLGLGYLTAHARLGVIAPGEVVPDLTTTTGSIVVRGDFPVADPLMLRTAGGAMSFEGAARAVDVRSTGGNASLRMMRPLERLVARTSSGSLTLVGGAREVHTDTASGAIDLAGLSGSAEVQTTTGKITLTWDRLDPQERVSVRSSSGQVELALPAGVSPRGALTTTTGTIRCELPGTLSAAGDRVDLAGDGPTLEVETASADIILRVRTDLVD